MTAEVVLTNAIKKYGAEKQREKAIEEMGELIVELCRYDISRSDVFKIAEEIADVHIMLTQLTMMFDCDELVRNDIEYKIERLANKLKE